MEPNIIVSDTLNRGGKDAIITSNVHFRVKKWEVSDHKFNYVKQMYCGPKEHSMYKAFIFTF